MAKNKGKRSTVKNSVIESKVNQSNSNIQKEKWYENGILKTFGAIALIAGATYSCTRFYYENYQIPELNENIKNLKVELKKWQSTSELAKCKSEYENQNKVLDTKNELIKNQNNQLQENKEFKNAITQAMNNLKKQNSELLKLNQQFANSYKDLSEKLTYCKNDLELKNEINRLRKIIESNNNSINRNDYYKPTEVQIQTWRQDNQYLNAMIAKYQEKLQCQNQQ